MSSPPDDPLVTLGSDLASIIQLSDRPIHRQNRWVRGPVIAQSCDFDHRVDLKGTIFTDVVDLRDVHFRRTVDLRGCMFLGGLIMEGTCVQGSLLMDGVVIGEFTPGPSDPAGQRPFAARLSLLRVRGDLLARGLLCAGDMDLTRAEIRGHVDISSTEDRQSFIAGSLKANAAVIGGNARGYGLVVTRDIDAESMRVGGKLTFAPLREEAESGEIRCCSLLGGRLNLPVARVGSELNLSAITVVGRVDLQTAEFRGGLFCRCKLGFRPLLLGNFHAVGARIHGTADFSGGVLIGRLNLQGLTLFGPLILRDARYSTEGPPKAPDGSPPHPGLAPIVFGEVALSYAQVTGSIQLSGAWLCEAVRLDTATVTGFVELSQARVDGDLSLKSATIRGGLFCLCVDRLVPRITGSVRARAARIDSEVTFVGAEITGSVDFAGACISGPVSLRGGCEPPRRDRNSPAPAEEPVPADQQPCRIDGPLDFSDAVIAGSFVAPHLVARSGLKLARAEVRGSLELLDADIKPLPAPASTNVAGDGAKTLPAPGLSLDAVGARIRGALHLNGASMQGSVDLQNSRIGGGLFCGKEARDGQDTATPSQFGGTVKLDGAEILMQADFRGATIPGELSLERARVEGDLRCDIGKPDRERPGLQRLDVRNARIRHLDLCWEPKDGRGNAHDVHIRMDGCLFHELTVPRRDYASLFDGQDHTRDGIKDGTKDRNFRQRSYLAVERWLRERGDDDAAEKVYDRMRIDRRRTLGRFERSGDRLVGSLRKMALAFQALIIASAVVYVASVLIFSDPESRIPGKDAKGAPAVQGTTPASPPTQLQTAALPLAAAMAGARPAASPRDSTLPLTDAMLMATRLHFPMLNLPGKDRWEPSDRPIVEGSLLRYDFYATLISFLSYLVVPLVIGGMVTTWLQRRSGAG